MSFIAPAGPKEAALAVKPLHHNLLIGCIHSRCHGSADNRAVTPNTPKSQGTKGKEKEPTPHQSPNKGSPTHTKSRCEPYICICTYIHIYIYTYIHIYIYAYMHIYIYTYIHIYIYTYIHIYIYTYIHIHIYTYTHINIYTYAHINIYTYIHIYACIHMPYLQHTRIRPPL